MLPTIRYQRVNDPFEAITREFDRALGRGGNEGSAENTWAPYAVDVHEDADHFYIEAEMPGFTPEGVDVTLEDGVLTIRAQRKQEARLGQPMHIERRWTQFQRSFTLPVQVDETNVRASLDDGVLTVTLDKKEEVKPRKIPVAVGHGAKTAPNANGNGNAKGAESPEPRQEPKA